MRVLWVHNFPPKQTSSGVFMHQLAERMAGVGVHADVHYTGSLRSPFGLISAAKRVRELSARYDVTHAQFGSACGLVCSFAQGPKLLSLRGSDLWGFQNGAIPARLHGVGARNMTRWSLSKYDRVLVMSDRMKSVLADRYGYRGTPQVVPDGIDLDRFHPMQRMEARAALGFPDDERPWVLFSSLVHGNSVKRPWLATGACDAARRTRPDIVLKSMTGVTHDKVPLWLNACNLVLLTSTHEGWPNIIKEALCCDVPFVSTDVSDLSSIADAEPACRIADPEPERLAAALLSTLEEPRPSGARRHVEHMEIGAVASTLRSVYDEISGTQSWPMAA